MHFSRPAKGIRLWFQQIWCSMPSLQQIWCSMPSLHAKMQPIHKLLNSVSEFRQTQLHFPRPAKCTRPSFGKIAVERHPHTRTCFKLPDSATWRKTKCIFRGLLNAFGHGFSKSGQPVHSSVNFSGAVDCKPNDSHSAVGDAQWDYVATCGLNAQILGRCYASACMNSLGSYDVSQALAGAHSCCRVVASRPFLRCKPWRREEQQRRAVAEEQRERTYFASVFVIARHQKRWDMLLLQSELLAQDITLRPYSYCGSQARPLSYCLCRCSKTAQRPFVETQRPNPGSPQKYVQLSNYWYLPTAVLQS